MQARLQTDARLAGAVGAAAAKALRWISTQFLSGLALLIASSLVLALTPSQAKGQTQSATPTQPQSAAAAQTWPAMPDGSIVLFRHANAPGVGDPPQFKLGDCSTQRNLDEAGRAQAKRIGQAFRERKVRVGAVLTSQWCRTRDTAQEAFPGQWREESTFNSFFADSSQSQPQTRAALALLAQWRGPGVMVVTTHQVNVTALTGIYPASGEGVVVRVQGGKVLVLGQVQP